MSHSPEAVMLFSLVTLIVVIIWAIFPLLEFVKKPMRNFVTKFFKKTR